MILGSGGCEQRSDALGYKRQHRGCAECAQFTARVGNLCTRYSRWQCRRGSVATGGQTTIIQRLLERRAERPPSNTEETTASIAVMLRVVPAPKALLVILDPVLRQQLERRITSDVLEVTATAQEDEGLRLFAAEFRPVVITDSLETVRKLRARAGERAPLIVYISELDESAEREVGLLAGADECVGRRATEREIDARLAAVRRITELESVLRITLEENRKLSATDDLTRVASRRFFSKHFPREMERAARYGRGLSLVLCDIDFFKKLNDTLGHAGGDQILRQFGGRLQQHLRRGIDWVARIGGEEFAVVLPETTYEHALEVARKLRLAVAGTPFTYDRKHVEVTASFGLCGLDRVPVGERQLAQRVLKIADAALYRSKHGGRNRVTATMYGGPP
jgi:diguanylate cyclase (GGDEF)-like protein